MALTQILLKLGCSSELAMVRDRSRWPRIWFLSHLKCFMGSFHREGGGGGENRRSMSVFVFEISNFDFRYNLKCERQQ